ncbi:MAG: hypothetical protein ACK416_04675 [Zestosphaera sp.]
MSRYRSSLSKLLSRARNNLLTLVLAALFLLFYLHKTSLITPYMTAVVVFVFLNIVFVFRRSIEHYFAVASYLLVVFIYTLLHAVLAGVLEYLVDAILILVILFTYLHYYYLVSVQEFFQSYIPFLLLVSTIVGVYLGVEYPLRYALLTLLDSIVSVAVSSTSKSVAYRYVFSASFFILLYTSPVIDVKIGALLSFTALHLIRNKLIFSSGREHLKHANIILGLDLLIKPFAVILA